MRKFVAVLVSSVALLCAVGMAGAQTAPPAKTLAKTALLTYTGTITELDRTGRIITTSGPEGVHTWEIPQSITQAQIDGLKLGDVISVNYFDAISLRKKPAGEAVVDTVDPTTHIRTATITVTAVDNATRTLTFTGANGRTYTRSVVDQADIELLRTVAPGDRADVSWYETMEIIHGAVGDDWRNHRVTASILWGPDNQFSGKMIKAANGTTTSGAPINLDETTFDETYGRMALFKVGVGYRTSARAEIVVNLVIERSSAETVQVGTVGTARVPVSVNFDDYNYWGVEGGQRFFFSKGRVTPYVGYLVGLNRFGDIRGTFVNTPSNLLPGYAAQDQKFFEKSWALSFGPTGGVLIGLGPIELMAETQFRYMGGLSDVDWLVEEGLRDINSQSSRWSVPFLFGARVRF